MSAKKLDINIFFMYFSGGTIGFLGALILLHLIHTLTSDAAHTFIYHWLIEQSPLYGLTTTASLSAVGVLSMGQYITRKAWRGEANKVKELDETSRAKSEAISFASHELRTPITSVKWGIKSLLEEDYGQLSQEQKRVLSEIYQTNENMQTLLIDFLDSSKIDIGKLELSLKSLSLFDLEKEVKRLIVKKQPAITKKNIILKYHAAINGQLFVLTDLNRIGQVVNNLLENAIDYTVAGGQIAVTLFNNHNDFQFTIADSGIGIPAQERAKVFVKFFRATNARQSRSSGTGLGLYLCKKLIEGHQGRIWFESPALVSSSSKKKAHAPKGNAGTRFSFTLPIRAPRATEELFRKI